MLGICASNSIVISDSANNNNPAKGITIQGSLFSLNQGLTAQDYSTKPVSGTINLLGGVSQLTRQGVGEMGSNGLTNGYLKNYIYDNRMLVTAPPCFPTTGSYEILEWWE